jgi:4-hydroxythreonine-4-phosphate dehydrogenase
MAMHTIALSTGDPAGIGPELVLKLVSDRTVRDIARLVVFGSAQIFWKRASMLRLPFDLPPFDLTGTERERPSGPVLVDVEAEKIGEIEPGRASATGGKLAIACVEGALRMVQDGLAEALVTGPVNKVALGLAGYPWAGHTDFLKARTGAGTVVMMLVGGGLRVGLVTHHVPLSEVPGQLSVEKLVATLRLMHAGLADWFGLEHPRIAVAGLNPHASDSGRFGAEEARIIAPAVRLARDEGINCDGPHPPDTLFIPSTRSRYDAVLAMYHDQGLIPLKMLAFGRAVNVTLGLPVVRTSVDHGTAYDIVGKGVASTDSLVEAIRLAVEIVERRKK